MLLPGNENCTQMFAMVLGNAAAMDSMGSGFATWSIACYHGFRAADIITRMCVQHMHTAPGMLAVLHRRPNGVP